MVALLFGSVRIVPALDWWRTLPSSPAKVTTTGFALSSSVRSLAWRKRCVAPLSSRRACAFCSEASIATLIGFNVGAEVRTESISLVSASKVLISGGIVGLGLEVVVVEEVAVEEVGAVAAATLGSAFSLVFPLSFPVPLPLPLPASPVFVGHAAAEWPFPEHARHRPIFSLSVMPSIE